MPVHFQVVCFIYLQQILCFLSVAAELNKGNRVLVVGGIKLDCGHDNAHFCRCHLAKAKISKAQAKIKLANMVSFVVIISY